MIEAHLKRLRKRDCISAAEERAIRGITSDTRHFPAHRTLIREGEPLSQSLLLIDGWLARAVDMQSGERLFTEIHVPGDFADLHSFTLKRLDHDVIALTDCKVAIVPHERLYDLTSRFPHLGWVYWYTTNVDASIHRQWTVSLAGRNALARMAHLLCELFIRLEIVGLTEGMTCDLPLTQQQLAGALGLTSVHVNRTLQEIRRQGLVELADKRLRILDFEALKRAGEFDPAYLFLDFQPERPQG